MRLGRFDVIEEIGRGGMGVVYRAVDPELGRDVAIKRILEVGDADDVRRFLREAELVGGLSHAGIAGIHEIGRDEGGRPFIVMPFVRGTPLDQLIRTGPLSPESAVSIVARVARAVEHAHREGVLHRDIKPANVIVREVDGEPVLLDFGLALLWTKPEARITRTNERLVAGTPAYMAPETVEGVEANVASDVYGLGAMLFDLLTGRPPVVFDPHAPPVLMLHAVATAERPSPRSLRPEIPEAIDAVCRRALDADPIGRPGSAGELVDELEAAASSRGARSSPARSRFRSGLLITALLVVVAGILGTVLATRPSSTSTSTSGGSGAALPGHLEYEGPEASVIVRSVEDPASPARHLGDEPLELEPGRWHVEAVASRGRRARGIVEVVAGRTTKVRLVGGTFPGVLALREGRERSTRGRRCYGRSQHVVSPDLDGDRIGDVVVILAGDGYGPTEVVAVSGASGDVIWRCPLEVNPYGGLFVDRSGSEPAVVAGVLDASSAVGLCWISPEGTPGPTVLAESPPSASFTRAPLILFPLDPGGSGADGVGFLAIDGRAPSGPVTLLAGLQRSGERVFDFDPADGFDGSMIATGAGIESEDCGRFVGPRFGPGGDLERLLLGYRGMVVGYLAPFGAPKVASISVVKPPHEIVGSFGVGRGLDSRVSPDGRMIVTGFPISHDQSERRIDELEVVLATLPDGERLHVSRLKLGGAQLHGPPLWVEAGGASFRVVLVLDRPDGGDSFFHVIFIEPGVIEDRDVEVGGARVHAITTLETDRGRFVVAGITRTSEEHADGPWALRLFDIDAGMRVAQTVSIPAGLPNSIRVADLDGDGLAEVTVVTTGQDGGPGVETFVLEQAVGKLVADRR